jgi:hypothetical protein
VNASSKLTIQDIIQAREIREVVHFTTNLGFLGCLATGEVLPRNRLRDVQLLQHILTLNAPFRAEDEDWFDRTENWIEFVNLSISEISTNLFGFSLKWHADKHLFWVIMGFDPILMGDDGVFFSTTNNIYPFTRRGAGPAALEALFAAAVPRKAGWKVVRGNRSAHLTTCEQAEVLYPNGVPMEYLETVYVRAGEDGDWATAMLRTYNRSDVQVILDPGKFNGSPN